METHVCSFEKYGGAGAARPPQKTSFSLYFFIYIYFYIYIYIYFYIYFYVYFYIYLGCPGLGWVLPRYNRTGRSPAPVILSEWNESKDLGTEGLSECVDSSTAHFVLRSE